MSTTINEKMRLLRQDIRALENTVKDARRKAQAAFLTPEVVAGHNKIADDAQALITKKEAEMEALRNSSQLDLFKS